MGTLETLGVFETIDVGGRSTRFYATGLVEAGRPGVVVFHPWWGLNHDVVAFADRLGEAGFAVFAPDSFDGQVALTIEDADRISSAADERSVDAIALATIDALAERLGAGPRIGAVGFSFGGAWSMWTPTQREQVLGSVVYYGSLSGPSLTRTRVPVLGHFAEDDPYETDETVTAFEEALRSARREVTIHHYPGSGHWFAEPSRDAYRADAADLAFGRTVDFLRWQLSE